MSEVSIEDYVLDTFVGLANYHSNELRRQGNSIQTLNGDVSITFHNIQFGERSPGDFLMLTTLQISAPSKGIADIYDTLLEGGPTGEIPVHSAISLAYHLFQFVTDVLYQNKEEDTELILKTEKGNRVFGVYFYGPITRASNDETIKKLEEKLENSWIYKQIFEKIPSAFGDFKPYWVKVNHLKSHEANTPECRLDENEWLDVQTQISTFQWPTSEGLMGYKQFIIFLPKNKE